MAEFDVVPVAIGVLVVVAGAVIANFLLNKKDKSGKSSGSSSSGSGSKAASKQSSQLRALVDPQEKYLLPLIEKEEISHDTRRYRFGLPSDKHILGLPVGQHIHLSATINEELVIRAYTPVSCDDDHGFVDLVVKVYKKNVHPKFPEGGKMSQHLESLAIGDRIAFRGPSGRLQYLGNGKFSIKKLRKDPAQIYEADKVSLIAGGTGITPMLQLIREVLKHADTDKTQLSLIFANQTEDDILLKPELDDLAARYPDQFKLWYTLDRPQPEWTQGKGFITDEMIKAHLFEPSPSTLVLMCGPPPMVNYACIPALEKLGYQMDRTFAY